MTDDSIKQCVKCGARDRYPDKRRAQGPCRVCAKAKAASKRGGPMTTEKLEYFRRWRAANREKVRSTNRKCNSLHKARFAAGQKARRLANVEAAREKERLEKRAYRVTHPGVLRDQFKAWRYRFPEKQMWHQARVRARRLGLAFEIEASDIVIPETCPVLGIRLVLASTLKVKSRGFAAASPSLDRIDNAKGYVKGNVWVISCRANLIKRDATLQELEALVSALRRHSAASSSDSSSGEGPSSPSSSSSTGSAQHLQFIGIPGSAGSPSVSDSGGSS
jgi:hypothetical protein